MKRYVTLLTRNPNDAILSPSRYLQTELSNYNTILFLLQSNNKKNKTTNKQTKNPTTEQNQQQQTKTKYKQTNNNNKIRIKDDC